MMPDYLGLNQIWQNYSDVQQLFSTIVTENISCSQWSYSLGASELKQSGNGSI